MPDDPLFLGVDIGTSGARAIVIDEAGAVRASGKAAMAEFDPNPRAPRAWAGAVEAAIRAALARAEPLRIVALAIDGTSGTMLAVDARGEPLADALMYNDPCADPDILAAINRAAPEASAARGASSALARAMILARIKSARILHQADWIALRFSGRFVSDANNALKTGYDAERGAWPDWLSALDFEAALLPDVLEPGATIGPVTAEAARAFGLSPGALVVAGTTDGCASFLATGASEPGEGVTALGTTLTLKILSDRPISAPAYGIYSHKLLGRWLAGGASNSGGAALLKHFAAAEIAALSERIDSGAETGLDYYPLPGRGERFPIADPALAPRLAPRPPDDALFLQGMLEGIAGIEASGYARLAEFGAPRLASVRSVGGGAANRAWTAIRARKLGVPFRPPLSEETAYGTALLARRAVSR
jgi:xylulokinase